MPSLAKDSRARSPYWVCCFLSSDGRRLKKSTKQRDRSQAWEVCLALDRAERLAGQGALTEQIAKKLIGEVLERTGQQLRTFTAEAWFDKWLADASETISPSTLERYRQVKREFMESLGRRAKLSIASITDDDVRTYRKTLRASGLAGKTCNNAVKCLSAAFNRAVDTHIIATNPCTSIEPLAEDTAARKTFTQAQVENLLKAADGDWRRAILFGYHTGARLGDVAEMQWNQIDFVERVVRFMPRKTKKKKMVVSIPLHPELQAELLRAPGIGKTPVFPSLAGKDTGGCNGLSAQFAAIMEKADIKPEVICHVEGGRKNTTLSYHSLRHTFNSALANRDVPQELRMRLTGHSQTDTNDGYTHVEMKRLRKAVARLPSVSKGAG